MTSAAAVVVALVVDTSCIVLRKLSAPRKDDSGRVMEILFSLQWRTVDYDQSLHDVIRFKGLAHSVCGSNFCRVIEVPYRQAHQKTSTLKSSLSLCECRSKSSRRDIRTSLETRLHHI